jgi:hypothetical protein
MALVGHSIRVWQADKGDWVVGDVTVSMHGGLSCNGVRQVEGYGN